MEERKGVVRLLVVVLAFLTIVAITCIIVLVTGDDEKGGERPYGSNYQDTAALRVSTCGASFITNIREGLHGRYIMITIRVSPQREGLLQFKDAFSRELLRANRSDQMLAGDDITFDGSESTDSLFGAHVSDALKVRKMV